MTTLAEFQAGFLQALLDRSPASVARASASSTSIAALAAQPAFAVHRNTALKGCVDALAACYPCVRTLVGDDWFRGFAADFARRHLPQSPALVDYGGDFVEALAASEPAAELPYLAGVARLDRAWTESHLAADAPTVEPSRVARLARSDLSSVRLTAHPAARWSWFDAVPVVTLWSCTRVGAPVPLELDWKGEGVLITRAQGAIEWTALGRAGCAFMSACATGQSLAEAALAAFVADRDVDLGALMACTLRAGAFSDLRPGT